MGNLFRKQYTRARHAFFDQLHGFVSGNRGRFAVAAGVDFADVFDHADLHRHDFQLFADFFADGVFAATANTGQFVLRQFVDDFGAGQVGRALACAFHDAWSARPPLHLLLRQRVQQDFRLR